MQRSYADTPPSSSRPRVSFFTKGRRLAHDDSYIIVDQCYVQYIPVAQLQPQRTLPILFIHGGGLTGAQWEATPDLRPGWACLASQLGYDVYLLDTIDNGRSARAPDTIRPDRNIEHRTAKSVWENFRIGDFGSFETRQAFQGGQFPVDHFDALLATQVSRRRTNDETETRGVADVIRAIGDCYIVAHSHGAALIVDAVAQSESQSAIRQHIQSMVLVEPGPTLKVELLRASPRTLVIWGDFFEHSTLWSKIMKPIEDSAVEIMHLPQIGIRGNSHFPMSDRNSDEVFAVIEKWLRA